MAMLESPRKRFILLCVRLGFLLKGIISYG